MRTGIFVVGIPTDPGLQLGDSTLMAFLEYLNRTPEELFYEGDQLKIGVYRDSNLADLSTPAALEQTKSDEPAIAVILAIDVRAQGISEVIGQMRIYDAHKKLPLNVENDFGGERGVLAPYRHAHQGEMMVYLGALAANRERVHGTPTLKKMFTQGLAYAMEQNYVQAFACVNPRHVRYYQELMGFSLIARTSEVKVVQAPGALIRTSPNELNMLYFTR